MKKTYNKKITKKQQKEEEIKKLQEEIKKLKEDEIKRYKKTYDNILLDLKKKLKKKKIKDDIKRYKKIYNNIILDFKNELKRKEYKKIYDDIIQQIKKPKKHIYLIDKENNITKIKKNDFFILQKFTDKTYKDIQYKKILNNEYKIIDTLDEKKEYNFRIKLYLVFDISADKNIERIIIFTYYGSPIENDIKNKISEEIKKYFRALPNADNIRYNYFIFSTKLTDDEIENTPESKKSMFKFKNMILEREAPLKIFNSVYENYTPPAGQNCLKSYIREICPKIAIKNINKILGEEPTAEKLYFLCVKYNIKLRVYNIDGELLMTNDIIKKTSYKSIIICIYNNHIYPINKEKILNKSDLKDEYIYIEDDKIDNIFINFLIDGILPENIKISSITKNKILSFKIKNIIYHTNKEYDICARILEVFGLGDKINIYICLNNIYKIIEKLYIKENINSLWERHHIYIKGGYTYHNENIKDLENICTIDKNKAYSHALLNLDFLIVVDDIRTSEINIYNNEDIIDHYLYNVIPEMSSLLLPDTNIYSGNILKFARAEGLKFEIKEILKTTKTKNYFKNMIDDIYKKIEPKHAKEIINRMLGKFGTNNNKKENIINIKVANMDETEATRNGYKLKLNDIYNIIYNTEEKIDVFTRAPIRNQVIDEARITIYKQIKKMNININDIIQIKTDSITINNKINYNLDMNTDPIDGWKVEEKYIEIPNRTWADDFITLSPEKIKNNKEIIINKNNFYNGYAGCGKSYLIKNDLIKKINDYVILTPSHATLKEYKKENLNCQVTAKYTLTNNIPKEKNIIIDECGMLNYNDFIDIIKYIKLEKNIYMFGDFKQLLPVCENKQLDNEIYINNYFNYQINTKENHRNNFSIEYYDYLRNIKEENINEELIKYNSLNYYDADHIICYRHETIKKYNNLMIKKLKLNFDDIGVKIICKSNKLKDKEIYNNFEYIITDKDEEDEILTLNDIYIISFKEYKKYFILGYAKTLYCIQGQTVKSFYYPPEDGFMLDGRRLYTLISRLKQEKI